MIVDQKDLSSGEAYQLLRNPCWIFYSYVKEYFPIREDFLHSVFADLLSRDFFEKYNPDFRTSKKYYLKVGVRNWTISFLRRKREREWSLESFPESRGRESSALEGLEVQEFLESLSNRNRVSRLFAVGEEVLPFSIQSCISLSLRGYSQSEIARIFQVSRAAINRIFHQVREDLIKGKVYKKPEEKPKPKKISKMSRIMSETWRIRKEAAEKYNVKVSAVSFSECLKIAWEKEKKKARAA